MQISAITCCIKLLPYSLGARYLVQMLLCRVLDITKFLGFLLIRHLTPWIFSHLICLFMFCPPHPYSTDPVAGNLLLFYKLLLGRHYIFGIFSGNFSLTYPPQLLLEMSIICILCSVLYFVWFMPHYNPVMWLRIGLSQHGIYGWFSTWK